MTDHIITEIAQQVARKEREHIETALIEAIRDGYDYLYTARKRHTIGERGDFNVSLARPHPSNRERPPGHLNEGEHIINRYDLRDWHYNDDRLFNTTTGQYVELADQDHIELDP